MITPRSFPQLRRLATLSGRLMQQHQALYRAACEEWNAIQSRWRRVSWEKAPAGLELLPEKMQALVAAPIASLDLGRPAPDGKLAAAVAEVRGELNARGIPFFPAIVAGEDEFFTYDRATTVNVPWYLFTDELWWLVNDRHFRYDQAEVTRVLRHEVAHAVGYAFEIWKRPLWRDTFGDFEAPYLQAYAPDPDSKDYVRHLHRSGPWQNAHYAQKHPDEDWAETFATWLTPGLDWRAEYAGWPVALAKLQAVDALARELMGATPTNRAPGRVEDWRQLEGTVRGFLGVEDQSGWSDHAALARREPEVLASVVLHELYFEQLEPGVVQEPALPAGLAERAVEVFGSVESWQADLRAMCLEGIGGWALVTWDRRLLRLRNALVRGHADGVPAGADILLAIDLHEHAYAADYGNRRDLYAAAVMASIAWGKVDRRGVAAGAWPLSA